MWKIGNVREIINILMDSKCYFRLTLRERHRLITYMLTTLPYAER